MRKFRHSQLFWPVLSLIVILMVNLILNPGFFALSASHGHLYGSLIDILMRSTPLVLTALGMTLVIATGGVDLSVGAIAALTPAVAVMLIQQGYSAELSLFAGIVAAALIGLWNGTLIAAAGLQPIVATLIAMVTGRGLAQLMVDGQIIAIESPLYSALGTSYFLMFPLSVTLVVLAVILLSIFCRKTAAGLFIEALGSNAQASRFIGLNTFSIRCWVYIISAVLAGCAGILVSSNVRAVDVNNLGLYLELDAILAVVIGGNRLNGGRFSLMGSVIGALIIQTVSTTINTQGIAIESMLIVKSIVVILVCLLQSSALRFYFRLKNKNRTVKI